jgi:hypothetical protein
MVEPEPRHPRAATGAACSLAQEAEEAMTESPAWVYDLVIELIEQEELHPTLYFTSGAFEGYAKYDWCAGTALAKVPPDVVAKATAIRTYKHSQEAT